MQPHLVKFAPRWSGKPGTIANSRGSKAPGNVERCGGYDFHEEEAAAAAKDRAAAEAAQAKAAAEQQQGAELRKETASKDNADAGVGPQGHAVGGRHARTAAGTLVAGADGQGAGSVGHLSDEVDAELDRSVRAAAEGKLLGSHHTKCQRRRLAIVIHGRIDSCPEAAGEHAVDAPSTSGPLGFLSAPGAAS
eukprot:scaffold61165_cov19-Tisochrysis_lutea.AAC.2